MDTPVMADQIGRHGSLMLMKRSDPTAVLTGFGIDSDELTFGSAENCDVRLYYKDVSALHCKIVFPDKKAFLVVMGLSGVLLDGDRIRPTMTNTVQPTTVALQNNSDIEIHGKHFRFAYPPKEMRPMLYSTPPRADRRALRLSMIESARVFSPRPSPIPAENLRVLKSPIKRNPSPMKPTPLSQASTAENDEGEENEDIVLVDGNHPRVVEEEKDLVILEDVVRKAFPTGTPTSGTPLRQVNTPAAPSQTPARRGRPSLHRAVLIRNVQRAAMRAEMEEEERNEEEEVLGTVVDAVSSGESDDDAEEWEPREGEEYEEDRQVMEGGEPMDVDGPRHGEQDYDSDDSYDDEDEDGRPGHELAQGVDGQNEDAVEDAETEMQEKSTTKTLGWRKSLERLWPFRSLSPEKVKDEEADTGMLAKEDKSVQPEQSKLSEPDRPDDPIDVEEHHEQPHGEHDDQDEDEANERPAPLATPVRRAAPSHAYYTPQIARPNFGLTTPASSHDAAGVGRGLGRLSLGGGPPQRMPVKTPWKVEDIVVSLPPPPTHTPQATPARGRPSLSEAERRAIRERRQSARTAPDEFMGRVPGMTPGRNRSTSPVKESASPIKASTSRMLHEPVQEEEPATHVQGHASSSNAPILPDTRGLLDRMMSTIEDMKERRRQSLAASPIKPVRPPQRVVEDEDESTEEEEDEGGERVAPQKEIAHAENAPEEKDKQERAEETQAGKSSEEGSEEEWDRLPAPPVLRGRLASPVKPSSSGPSASTSQPASVPQPAAPQTPNMRGVRELFMHQKSRGLSTPAVEAVGDMFAPLQESAQLATPGATPPITPSTGATTGEVDADDEATPGEGDDDEVMENVRAEKPRSGRVMKGKGKKAAEAPQPPATGKKTTRSKATEPPATRTRATRAPSKTPQPDPSNEEEELPPPLPPAPKTTARGRRAKPAEEEHSTGDEVAPAPRTRKGNAPPSATKTTKAAAPAPPPAEEEPSSEEPVPRTRTRTRTRTTPTPEPELQPKATRSTRKTRAAPAPEPIEEEPAEELPKRATRTRKATAVKTEVTEDDSTLAGPSSEAKTTGRQLRKPTATRGKPAAGAAKAGTSAKAGASAAKEKATAATPRAESPLEKENTEEQGATKVRVTRRGGRRKVKEEEEEGAVTEPEPVATRTRVTRSRAART